MDSKEKKNKKIKGTTWWSHERGKKYRRLSTRDDLFNGLGPFFVFYTTAFIMFHTYRQRQKLETFQDLFGL